jgi:hydrogenase maturation factor HypE
MKKLNFKEYLDCLDVLGESDNPLKLYEFLKEKDDPDIEKLTDESAHELIQKITEYIETPISVGQKLCIGMSMMFGIPYNQIEVLPKEVGVYLMALYSKKSKEDNPKLNSIGDQIKDAKNKIETQNMGGINPQQLAAIFQALQGNKG